jgi:hypothetical protein
MFHSRAARELGLLDLPPGDTDAPQRFVSGVSDSNSSSGSSAGGAVSLRRRTGAGSRRRPGQQPQPDAAAPPAAAATSSGSSQQPARLSCQAGRLPELVIRGQAGGNVGVQGALVLQDVRALFSKAGGLDISLYSAGMVCADLLSRMQVVVDYPNKRIGWKMPPLGVGG